LSGQGGGGVRQPEMVAEPEAKVKSEHRSCQADIQPREWPGQGGTMRTVLIILGVILLVAAVAGGLAVNNLLWLLLILALVVFAIGVYSGRITE
jgi:hypothetical protein